MARERAKKSDCGKTWITRARMCTLSDDIFHSCWSTISLTLHPSWGCLCWYKHKHVPRLAYWIRWFPSELIFFKQLQKQVILRVKEERAQNTAHMSTPVHHRNPFRMLADDRHDFPGKTSRTHTNTNGRHEIVPIEVKQHSVSSLYRYTTKSLLPYWKPFSSTIKTKAAAKYTMSQIKHLCTSYSVALQCFHFFRGCLHLWRCPLHRHWAQCQGTSSAATDILSSWSEDKQELVKAAVLKNY